MSTCPILLAFGFSNLVMLGWLAAAAAPLLIHFWSRHRHREAPWAAMQFLLAAMRKNARRLQLQQWLLLAVRTLIIALVVLAAAEPYGERLLAGGGRRPTHEVLVIDGSYSMAYRNGGETRFQRAKQIAASFVRESGPADTFTIILMSAPARTILGREVVNHATIASEIEALAQPHTAADLPGTLTVVEEALSAESTRRNAPDRQQVYFFTDLQRTTWQDNHVEGQPASGNPQSEIQIHARLVALAKRAPLAVIDVAQPRAPNLAVTQWSTSKTFVVVNQDVGFQATLHQFDDKPRTQCVVELVVDDVPVSEQIVDVPAGGDATVRFTHRFRATGSHAITARAAGDNLAIDDSRYLIVPVRDEIRVLCVAGREGAARYVASALNPNSDSESPLRPVLASESDLNELELDDFECIFLCNVAQFTADETERLRRYVAAGGGVVFFLGDRVVPESYNAIAVRQSAIGNAQSDGAPLLPARIVELGSGPQFGLDPIDYRHPIVAPFRGRERAGLLTMPVSRHYRLELSPSRPDAEVAASLPDGDPFIVTAPLGRGRTVLVATAGSLASVDAATGEPWTAWPTWPNFLPMIREMLAYAAGGRQLEWQQPVGSLLGGTLPASSSVEQDALRILRPDSRAEPVSLNRTVSGADWSYSNTDLSGVYAMRGSLLDKPRQFAVNVDPSEGDLTKADPRELPSELLVRDTWDDADDVAIGGQRSRAGWNQALLCAAFALLFVEAFLAWQFGRGAV